MSTNIVSRISKFIQEEFSSGQGELSPSEDLLASGRVDSMGIMRLVAFLESEFDFSVPPEDLVIDNFFSIDAIARYVQRSTQSTPCED